MIAYDGSEGARRAIGVAAALFPGWKAVVLAVAAPLTAGEAVARPTASSRASRSSRKAILRASGFKALHDEGEAFQREREHAGAASRPTAGRMDWYSFTVAFKGVLLEGLEVTFIVITFGTAQGRTGLAAAAAAAAVLVVAAVGALVRAPLERVPENTIKFVVGLLLTSFGIFWAGEGAGVSWPGSDLEIFGIVAFLGAVSFLLVRQACRRRVELRPAQARA